MSAGERVVVAALSAVGLIFVRDSRNDVSAQVTGQAFEVDRRASAIYVVTRRSGLLSFLGHNHAILATEWTTTLCWTEGGSPAEGGRIDVATRGLVIDSDSARAVAGTGRGPSAERKAELQERMLSGTYLAADIHELITLDRIRAGPAYGERVEVRAVLTIRGSSREVRFPVEIRSGSDGVRLRGVARVRQSDFGIRPESVAGVVRVADPVDIHFDLLRTPVGGTCRVGTGGAAATGPGGRR